MKDKGWGAVIPIRTVPALSLEVKGEVLEGKGI